MDSEDNHRFGECAFNIGNFAKPSSLGFSSPGTLPKKQTLANGNHSSLLVEKAAPETPLKLQRNKFVVPTNLSPFRYSPRQLVSSATKTRNVPTKLSSSYTCPSDLIYPPDEEETPKSMFSVMSSSSGGQSCLAVPSSLKSSISRNAHYLDMDDESNLSADEDVRCCDPSSDDPFDQEDATPSSLDCDMLNDNHYNNITAEDAKTLMVKLDGSDSYQVDVLLGNDMSVDDPFSCTERDIARFSNSLITDHELDSDMGVFSIKPDASFATKSMTWKSRVPIFLTHELFCSTDWADNFWTKAASMQQNEKAVQSAQIMTFGKVLDDFGFDDDDDGDGRLRSADLLDRYFEELEFLGTGSFSDVFKVSRRLDGAIFALKRNKHAISGQAEMLRKLQEVHAMWSVLGSSNCVAIVGAWMHQGYLYILMELCENGSLVDVIDFMASSGSRFSEFQVWHILSQLASGLKAMHDAGLVHLDIKPANILITQAGVLRIGDFGLSRPAGSGRDLDSEGDKYYMAPETLEGFYGMPADVFSLGLLTLELAANVDLPAGGPSWQNLRHGNYCELSFEGLSSALIQLIQDMTHPDPHRRPVIADVLRLSEQCLRELCDT